MVIQFYKRQDNFNTNNNDEEDIHTPQDNNNNNEDDAAQLSVGTFNCCFILYMV